MAELHGNVPKPEDIKRHLDQYVIGQELSKEILSVAVYNHYKRLRHESREILGLAGDDAEVQVGKSNILMIGPTGTGKTLLASTLARIVGVPFVVADATTLTQAGYVGDDVENILVRLLEAADGSVERAEWGIVYIDEVDKLAKSPEMAINTRDISGEGVQQALFRFVEGSQVKVAARGRRREGSGGEEVTIDTRNILFIAGGAFPGLEKHVEKRIGPPRGEIGFHAPMQDSKKPPLEELLAEIQPAEAGDVFQDYMSVVFGFEEEQRLGDDRQGRRRFRGSYLRLLQDWGFNSNNPQGAVLKGWAESRFGLFPTFHKQPLTGFATPAWMGYVEEKMASRFHNNCIYLQLDLLFEFCQWAIARFKMPACRHIRLYRGVDNVGEFCALGAANGREILVRLNNIVSFSSDRTHAGQFGAYILETDVPVVKLLFFNDLLPRHPLRGEAEYLVIGGNYRVRLTV
jgi:hypothetical protein